MMKEKILKKGFIRSLFSVVLTLVIMLALIPMNSITAYAALAEDASCTTNNSKNHWKYTGMSGVNYGGTRYTADDGNYSPWPLGSGKFASGDVPTTGDEGHWWYQYQESEGSEWKKCNGEHGQRAPEPDLTPSSDAKKDNDNHDSGSNDDDSRPAPPSPHQSAQNLIFSSLDTQLAKIDASSNGQATIDGKDLVNALPSATMQKIAENPNVTVFFTYIYNDAKYTTAIPAGTAIDSSVEWYGPIYMMTHFPTMWRQDANTSVPVVAPVQ